MGVGGDLAVRLLLPSFCLLRRVLFVAFPRHGLRVAGRDVLRGELSVSKACG